MHKDPMEQLRVAQPMPRGERLATWMTTPGRTNTAALWWRLWDGIAYPARVRLNAAPLALARELRRRERAEAALAHVTWQRDEWRKERDAERAARLRWEADAVALRAEVARLQPPTREDVERAVDAFDAAVQNFQMAHHSRKPEHLAKAKTARAALVALATRGAPPSRPVTGTTPQPPPSTDARSRDVLPRALEYVRGARRPESYALQRIQHVLFYSCGVNDVAAALEARADAGLRKYGVPLRTFNGRNAREDLAQELLDAFMYAVQSEMEEEDR